MSTTPRETLRAALDPKSVAIVGASENPNKIGGGARTRYQRSRPFAGSATGHRVKVVSMAAKRPRLARLSTSRLHKAVARGHVRRRPVCGQRDGVRRNKGTVPDNGWKGYSG